jgi:hypothetical protein
MKKLFGYWEVWHIVLAMMLYMIFYRYIDIESYDVKHVCFLLVMGIALLWEIAEYFWNLKAYTDSRHYLINSFKDMLAALIGSTICVLLLQ